jgi:hypothetical protein
VSTGKGRTTCSYFFPAGDKIIYASTHHWSEMCPADPDMSQETRSSSRPCGTATWSSTP